MSDRANYRISAAYGTPVMSTHKSLAVATATASTAVVSSTQYRFVSQAAAFIRFGASTATATSGDIFVPAGVVECWNSGGNEAFAYILASAITASTASMVKME